MKRIPLHAWIVLGMVAGAGWGTWLNQAYYGRFYDEAVAEVRAAHEARLERIVAWRRHGLEDARIAEVLGLKAGAIEAAARPWSDAVAATTTRAIQAGVDARFCATTAGAATYGTAAVFMALLQMIVVPLVFTSLVSGVMGLSGFGRLGRLGLRTAAWYLTTTLLACLTGLALVNAVAPGEGVSIALPDSRLADEISGVSAWDQVLAVVPTNPVAAIAEGRMLPIILFAILFGVFALTVGDDARRPVERFFRGAFEVMMRMTMFVIALAPVGIAALIARLVASTGPDVFASLAGYAATVAGGLAVHVFGTLPLLLWLVTRRNPYRVMRAMAPALATAFSTASSGCTLPVTMERVERGVGVSNEVSSFVLPLGATLNMDGTALYECVATVFVAQLYAAADPAFTLTAGAQITILGMALLVSVGAAGIPHAGLVMMVVIFQAVGLPVGLTALLWAVDRPLDMCRTAANVWSDAACAVAVAHAEGGIRDPVRGK